jgi:DNA-binding NtrC family response regulator
VMTRVMNNAYSILIADRNRHVRDFLKREMTAAGYRLQLAKDGREILRWIRSGEPFDLIILDPDLPDAGEIKILKTLQDQMPALPVVIHTFLSDYTQLPADMRSSTLVVKNGDSIDNLKKMVAQILEASHSKRPRHFISHKIHGNI